MQFIVKTLDRDGKEIGFENTVIGEEKEVTFENLEAVLEFIEGIKFSFPSTYEYRIIPTGVEQK